MFHFDNTAELQKYSLFGRITHLYTAADLSTLVLVMDLCNGFWCIRDTNELLMFLVRKIYIQNMYRNRIWHKQQKLKIN